MNLRATNIQTKHTIQTLSLIIIFQVNLGDLVCRLIFSYACSKPVHPLSNRLHLSLKFLLA